MGTATRPKIHTLGETAALLRTSPDTVRRWARLGLIRVIKLPSGVMRVPARVVEQLLASSAEEH